MKKSIIAGSTFFLIVSGFALAQEIIAPDFQQVDVNSDGVLNTSEANAALPTLGLTDSNQDGVISKADVKRVLPNIDFEEGDHSAIGPVEYRQIVQVMEEMLENA
ncbi:MAG: hypothetical protein Q8L60_06830 [Gammaproteobacteria bacterium]|nr:hypothetical protein [Gammaproteobacteria bacterium]MDP2140332.1 hypothetical protein [Gammaproteobacteria bacterium]MDP2346151.1 hypothetical protein [Gammaproteobacteria bacterium]